LNPPTVNYNHYNPLQGTKITHMAWVTRV